MSGHAITDSASEWEAARKELLAAEKEATAALAKVAEQRRALPWLRVRPSGKGSADTENDYVFQTAESGTDVTLKQMAATTPTGSLLIYHLMFDADWEKPCSSCSMWIDCLNGIYPHLLQKTAVVAVAVAPPDKLRALAEAKGWSIPLVSSLNSAFSCDFGVRFTPEQVADGVLAYNYGRKAFVSVMPGFSVFQLEPADDDGEIFHTYSAYARGLEPLNAVWGVLDSLPFGRNEAKGMDWTKHKSEYDVVTIESAKLS